MSNLVIATNVAGINTHRSLKLVSERGEKASEKLSSGFKVNRAGDDAAGLAISEKMRNQIKGLNMASKNAQDGISMIQTAEGGLAEVAEMIKRIRELTVQGANDTNVSSDRNKMATEIFQLTKEIWDTEEKVEFNGMKILKMAMRGPSSGTTPDGLDGKYFKLGPNSDQGMTIELNLSTTMQTPYRNAPVTLLYATQSMLNHAGLALNGAHGDNTVLGTAYDYSGRDDYVSGNPINGGIKGKTQTEWIDFMTGNIDAAAGNISSVRASLGAYQNRLEHTIKNLDVASENLSAAESRIRDTDMAKEMMEFTKSNVLSQAGISMLSQANQQPNAILSIIR